MLDTENLGLDPATKLGDYVVGNQNGHGPRYQTDLKRVAILGFAPSSFKEAIGAVLKNTEWTKENGCEIWGLNELYMLLEQAGVGTDRWDRWFDIHDPRSTISTRDDKNMKWLAAQTKPIYMTQHFSDVPASVPFPLTEIVRYQESDYLTNSIAMMIMLAAS